MALYLKKKGYRPRQVQDFIPTPMSLAATMYHTGIDPLTMKPCYTAKGLREKRLQKALLLYWDPEQHELVREALDARGPRRSHRHASRVSGAAGAASGGRRFASTRRCGRDMTVSVDSRTRSVRVSRSLI